MPISGGRGAVLASIAGGLCLAVAALAPGCAREQSRDLKRIGRVNDYAHVLSEQTQATLSTELDRYERETCHNVVVVIVPSLKGESITDFSARTVAAWNVVNPVLRDGILLTIAIDEGQARIEMGTAMEEIVEQGTAERILTSEMVPAFRKEDFDTGVARGVRAIMEEARRLKIPDDLRPTVCRQP